MNVTSGRITWVDKVHRGNSLTARDRLGDLILDPAPLIHLVLPLLGSVISAEFPRWLGRGRSQGKAPRDAGQLNEIVAGVGMQIGLMADCQAFSASLTKIPK